MEYIPNVSSGGDQSILQKKWEKIKRSSNYELYRRLQSKFVINANSKFSTSASTNGNGEKVTCKKWNRGDTEKGSNSASTERTRAQFLGSIPVIPIILPKKSFRFRPVIDMNLHVEDNQKHWIHIWNTTIWKWNIYFFWTSFSKKGLSLHAGSERQLSFNTTSQRLTKISKGT